MLSDADCYPYHVLPVEVMSPEEFSFDARGFDALEVQRLGRDALQGLVRVAKARPKGVPLLFDEGSYFARKVRPLFPRTLTPIPDRPGEWLLKV